MGMILPMIIFVGWLGLNATSSFYERQLTRTPPTVIAATAAQNFINYRSAVANYMSANPNFTGTIPLQSIAPYLPGINPSVMSTMSNVITSSPGVGVTVIVSAQGLAPGAAAFAMALSQNDASIGRVSNGQWTSYSSAIGGASVSIPDSNLVSMIQIN
ncbi:MAG: type IV pilus biogenesis protein PilM [Acidithiobacillus sp.]